MLQTKKIIAGMLGVMLLGGNSIAYAVDKGDWLLRFGVTMVSPDASSSGPPGAPDDIIDVDDSTSLSLDLTYMLSENIGLELLAAYPFTSDITLDGVGTIAETDYLPPTLSVQYHFQPKSNMRPYVGIGLNYTTFFSETITGTGTSAGLTSLSLDDSFGLALQGGIDFDISKSWYLNAVLRYVNIETTASTNVGNIDVGVNPWVYTLGVGTSF